MGAEAVASPVAFSITSEVRKRSTCHDLKLYNLCLTRLDTELKNFLCWYMSISILKYGDVVLIYSELHIIDAHSRQHYAVEFLDYLGLFEIFFGFINIFWIFWMSYRACR